MEWDVDYSLVVEGASDIVDAAIMRAVFEGVWPTIKGSVQTMVRPLGSDGTITTLRVVFLDEDLSRVRHIVVACDEFRKIAKGFGLKADRSLHQYKQL